MEKEQFSKVKQFCVHVDDVSTSLQKQAAEVPRYKYVCDQDTAIDLELGLVREILHVNAASFIPPHPCPLYLNSYSADSYDLAFRAMLVKYIISLFTNISMVKLKFICFLLTCFLLNCPYINCITM